jgi:threonine dehydrogenase-like Zn-dependent dehydrogenase
MRALVWHGKEDIRCDVVSDPAIQDPRDAIVKVTSCAICGSDLLMSLSTDKQVGLWESRRRRWAGLGHAV